MNISSAYFIDEIWYSPFSFGCSNISDKRTFHHINWNIFNYLWSFQIQIHRKTDFSFNCREQWSGFYLQLILINSSLKAELDSESQYFDGAWRVCISEFIFHCNCAVFFLEKTFFILLLAWSIVKRAFQLFVSPSAHNVLFHIFFHLISIGDSATQCSLNSVQCLLAVKKTRANDILSVALNSWKGK